MTAVILILSIYAGFIPLIFTIANRITYGPLLNDKEHLALIEKKVKYDCKLNMYNPTILTSGRLPYVSNVVFSLFGKYYMNEVGVIPRWTKMHKLIRQAFIDALDTKVD
jgi:hypothetical protein